MKLKKLILQGFKSFADKTEFEFQDGITVIVGPNGCGKSNVVDAIKWVLGEQRPSSLRGKEMMDVIFSGTDSRKSVGFAEVSLVLDNEQQRLPIDYLEVVVTRRLFRSGESEYLINDNKVRLRDIRELLMDSGGGPGAMTVMEQGNIDRLLRADPQERRLVFEEAAGIAKYRARRKETQRKLDRTMENLARMRDMLAEYETRQRSLKIQAGKARRFKEFTEELKKKRVIGALSRYHQLAQRRTEAQVELDRIQKGESAARSLLESAVASTEDRRKELDGLRELVSKGEAGMATFVGERRAAEEKQSALEREANELLARAAQADEARAEAERRQVELQNELEASREQRERAASEHGKRAEALAAANALLAEVESRVTVLREERDALDLSRTEAFAAETEARNHEVSGEAEQRTLEARLARMVERAESADEALRTMQVHREESGLELKRAEEELRALEARFTAAEAGVKQARVEAEEAATLVTRLSGEVAALRARRELLEGLVSDGEGLTSGTRALLESGLPGIEGTVADLVGDAGDAAAALDLALGDLAAAVVVDTTGHARAAIHWLKDGQRGRARIIPRDRVEEVPLPERFGDREIPLVGALLRGTRIVETLDEALSGVGVRVVALSGEECEQSGAIVGGTGGAGAGLVLRNAELAEVTKCGEETGRAHGEIEQRLFDARARVANWEATLDDLRPRLHQSREALRQASQAAAAAERVATARAEELELEQAERADVERIIADVAHRRERAQAQLATVRSVREELDAEANELQERLTCGSRDREQAAARQTEARVEMARWTEKAQASEAHARSLQDGIGIARRESNLRTDEAHTCRERRETCLAEVETTERLGVVREQEMEQLGRLVEERRQSVRELQEIMESGDSQVRTLRDAHDQRRDELERHRLKDNEIRLRLESLLEQVRRDYGLDLESIEIDEEALAAEPEQLEAEIEELRTKLERLGNVNHTALDQLSEVEEKLTFLRAQEADLVAADKQLRETIEKIDETCTTRFTDTFERVRGHFATIFRKLFGGGKAEIELEDPEDVLNSGIEIRVRPPGKELRNMALLSGGERSLTTVALLFSIYQTKPPPFCLLDEVDAALDEPNTVRMCEMLKEFAKRGQFIVITHARPTMTVADRLYGVTMPEAGVSRHVSVRFADIEAGRVVGLN